MTNEQPKPKNIEIQKCTFTGKDTVRVSFLDETRREDSVIVDIEQKSILIRHARDLCWTAPESEALVSRALRFRDDHFEASAFGGLS